MEVVGWTFKGDELNTDGFHRVAQQGLDNETASRALVQEVEKSLDVLKVSHGLDGLEIDLAFGCGTDHVGVGSRLSRLAEVSDMRSKKTARTSGASRVQTARRSRRVSRNRRRLDHSVRGLEGIRSTGLSRGLFRSFNQGLARMGHGWMEFLPALLEGMKDVSNREVGIVVRHRKLLGNKR